MSRLTRDGTAEPVLKNQILRHARGQGNIHFPCSADHEQDWQLFVVLSSRRSLSSSVQRRVLLNDFIIGRFR